MEKKKSQLRQLCTAAALNKPEHASSTFMTKFCFTFLWQC